MKNVIFPIAYVVLTLVLSWAYTAFLTFDTLTLGPTPTHQYSSHFRKK